jgi:alcohol dehydrogenase
MIAMPTTSGTGTEVTPYAVVSVDPVTHAKGAIADGKIVPDIALVDPLMTVTLPPKHTAMTGLDALSHAIESIMALTANPLSDALALTSIKLISENLRTAYHHGENINARYNLAWAASLAGWAISFSENTLGHALAQNFAPRYGIPHGISCAVSLPYAMDYNVPAIPDRLALIASTMGENISGLTKREAAIKAVKAVKHLLIDVEMPISLRELSVPKEDIPKLVDDLISGRTNQIPLLDKNPRKTTQESLLKVYERMWEGKMAE